MSVHNADTQGFFGIFGGRYVADALWQPLEDVANAFDTYWPTAEFQNDIKHLRTHFIGRPTPLYPARNLSTALGGAHIYLKLEGLAHTGAHKINNAIGQALLAKRMGKKRIIAETGAGQHGVATATACAILNIPCRIYMGAVDIRRQQPNVVRMRVLGAEVCAVEGGCGTLKDAVNAALRDWSATYQHTHYLLGSALGPHPFPKIVAAFQSIIGEESAAQCAELGISPDYCIACVGGGSNAIGFFWPWITQPTPQLIGVEAGGVGMKVGEHATRIAGEHPHSSAVTAQPTAGPDATTSAPATTSAANAQPATANNTGAAGITAQSTTDATLTQAPANTDFDATTSGTLGIAQGYKSYFIQSADGQLAQTHSISAGLDYPGIGPQLASLAAAGRIRFVRASDAEVLAALRTTARSEGIIAALESSHALAYAIKLAPQCAPHQSIIVNLSGTGDKDLFIIARHTQPDEWTQFLQQEART